MLAYRDKGRVAGCKIIHSRHSSSCLGLNLRSTPVDHVESLSVKCDFEMDGCSLFVCCPFISSVRGTDILAQGFRKREILRANAPYSFVP